MMVELESWEGEKISAVYQTFSVGNKTDNYKLTIKGPKSKWDMNHLNGVKFATADKGRDSADKCSENWGGGGGWWYKDCTAAKIISPTGEYKRHALTAIKWTGAFDSDNAVKQVTMKIKQK